ncbi:MAG TPA: CPBP family glutamic-type intramembrane protease [Ktedonosporobacter sp.]|nr:CPBP family glutamic-type intramembrane protease [Ktedonosporobacter sp.]
MIAVDTGELMKVILYVQDMNAQVAFYRDSLGLAVKEPDGVNDFRDFYWVELQTGSCSLILHTGGKGHVDEDTPKLVFRVSNIHASRANLLEKGVKMGEVRSTDPGALVCEGRDPEGNAFSLEGREDEEHSTTIVTMTPGMTPTYVSVNSRRGRSITLLRKNKFVMAAEILVVSAVLCSGVFLGSLQLITTLLLVMALLWLQGKTWSRLGLSNPQRWRLIIFLGATFGFIYALLQTLAIGPLIEHYTHPSFYLPFLMQDTSPISLISTLIQTWTSAAFVEEMVFRGYLMNRLADLFGHDGPGWAIALVLQSVVFGIAHLAQGPTSAIETGIYGIFAGLLYLGSSRNLWICAITRGAMETFALALKFAGL